MHTDWCSSYKPLSDTILWLPGWVPPTSEEGAHGATIHPFMEGNEETQLTHMLMLPARLLLFSYPNPGTAPWTCEDWHVWSTPKHSWSDCDRYAISGAMNSTQCDETEPLEDFKAERFHMVLLTICHHAWKICSFHPCPWIFPRKDQSSERTANSLSNSCGAPNVSAGFRNRMLRRFVLQLLQYC